MATVTIGATTPPPIGEGDTWSPQGVAIDAAGNLLFGDAANSRIRKVIGIAAPGR
jgi:hypothetical protein